MKNLPEDELFNSVENRLRNYSELPDDDVWNRISGVIPSGAGPSWIVWTNRAAATFSLVILFLVFYSEDGRSGKPGKPHADSIIMESDRSGPSPELKREMEDNAGSLKITEQVKRIADSKSPERFERSSFQREVNAVKEDDDNLAYGEIVETNSRPPVVRDEKAESDSSLTTIKELKKDSVAVVKNVIPPYKKRKSKVTFYSMISPSLSFQHVKPNTQDGIVVDKINSPGVMSHERLGFTIESGIQVKVSKRFQSVIGLSYYQQSQQLEYEESSDGAIVESGDDLNFDITPTTTTRKLDYNMRNIGVQAGILYTLKERGLMHKAGLMLQYQIGLMEANEGDVYDNSSSVYFNYQFLYRVEYTFRPGIGLFVQPTYTHSIVANESLDAPFKMKLSRAGLGVGIVYRF